MFIMISVLYSPDLQSSKMVTCGITVKLIVDSKSGLLNSRACAFVSGTLNHVPECELNTKSRHLSRTAKREIPHPWR